MLAWLLYATWVGSALGVAGVLAERGARGLGLPVRWVWAAAMAGTVAIPVMAMALAGLGGPGEAASSPASRADASDALILGVWAVVTLVLLASLRQSAWTLRRNARSWRTRLVEGRSVLVSTGFGPGVIGRRRSRVVLPMWVLGSPTWLRRLVVAHEVEHVRARDAALLTAGLGLAVLVPWCLPLWWHLRRLRQAVEADCDARVLAGPAEPRSYATALVAIAGRRTRDRLPVPALSLGAAELERRLRLMTRDSGRSRGSASGLVAVAGALVLAAALVPAPAALPTLDLPPVRTRTPTIPDGRQREATVILSVEPDPAAER